MILALMPNIKMQKTGARASFLAEVLARF
jgi:hypothetical protein